VSQEVADTGAVPLASELPCPAGWVDGVTAEVDGWRLAGWMVLPQGGPFEAIRVRWNERDFGLAAPRERPDLKDHLYWIGGVRDAGFSVLVPERNAAGRLELTGERGGRPVARLSTTFIAPHLEEARLPPASLCERVSDLSGDAFRLSGLKAFTDLWDRAAKYKGDPRALRILDWGCGCGRVARYLARAGVSELRGCDIDLEAVAWCSANLPGEFSSCAPEPPLPYEEGEIDVVFASSVFTHLGREDQSRWLSELRRVLSPDGLLVASVAGGYAMTLGGSRLLTPGQTPGSLRGRAVAFRRRVRLRRAGIIDRYPDDHLLGIAPSGYYRSVYQTQKFTTHAWARWFEVVEYVERGLAGHQDLVVMRPNS
jgi:SAM-dependent methyltransferase